MAFQKAKREKIWVKALLSGPSGSGKTYSALKLATGLAKACGSDIAAIDTENGRIRYYADEFDFDDMQLADFTPEAFIKGIDEAVEAGYKVLIIDSASAEWKKLNEIHDAMPGNSFQNWSKVKPRHEKLMEKILSAPLHIIVTARGKDEYVLEDKNGKQVPKKVGVGSVQENGIEYNYTVSFNVDQETHVAVAAKDNTHLFENRYEKLSERDGVALYEWANKGDTFAKPVAPVATKEVDGDLITDLTATIKKLIDGGMAKDAITEKLKAKFGTANYKKVTDEVALKEFLEELKGMLNE